MYAFTALCNVTKIIFAEFHRELGLFLISVQDLRSLSSSETASTAWEYEVNHLKTWHHILMNPIFLFPLGACGESLVVSNVSKDLYKQSPETRCLTNKKLV